MSFSKPKSPVHEKSEKSEKRHKSQKMAQPNTDGDRDNLKNAALKGLLRTPIGAYGLKTSLDVALSLLGGKLKKGVWKQRLTKIYSDPDTIRFACFLGLMSFTYRCLLRIFRKLHGEEVLAHHTIAGFIAASFIGAHSKSGQRMHGLYALTRALGDVIKVGTRQKILPRIPYAKTLIFAFAQIFIMYGTTHNFDVVDRTYLKWIQRTGDPPHERLQKTFRSGIDPKAMYRLPGEPFPQCYPTLHDNPSCLAYHLRDTARIAPRMAQIYTIAHLGPTLVMSPKKLLQISVLKKKAVSIARSTLFLMDYVFNAKLVLCWVRWLFQADGAWLAGLAGWCSGMALLIEDPRRREEFVLYVVPKALEIIYRLSKTHAPRIADVLRWKYLNVIAFQSAIAIWLTLMADEQRIKNCNGFNRVVMTNIFKN